MEAECNCGYLLREKHKKRHPIKWGACFVGFMECEEKVQYNQESYLSAFVFTDAFYDYIFNSGGSTRGFNGICWSPFLWFDVDRAELEHAKQDAIAICKSMFQFGVTRSDIIIFFSGSKGFHLGLPTNLWLPEPSVDFHLRCKQMALEIAGNVKIDTAIYAKLQPLRAPNSRHPRTGLYKRQFGYLELCQLTIGEILEASKKPKAATCRCQKQQIKALADMWSDAIARVEQAKGEATKKQQKRLASGEAKASINLLTRKFIWQGADEGERHRLLFSAAANLAEYGCPPALAYALLAKPALESGLSPYEAERQIECGLTYGLREGGADE